MMWWTWCVNELHSQTCGKMNHSFVESTNISLPPGDDAVIYSFSCVLCPISGSVSLEGLKVAIQRCVQTECKVICGGSQCKNGSRCRLALDGVNWGTCTSYTCLNLGEILYSAGLVTPWSAIINHHVFMEHLVVGLLKQWLLAGFDMISNMQSNKNE